MKLDYVKFSDEEKIKYFDELGELFYYSNFGLASKSQVELLMFGFYLESLINANMNKDGTIDYNKCSDYKISKELGITQQRVKNLKVKHQLSRPNPSFDWKKSFSTLINNARFNEATKKVSIPIPDPNLRIEIENRLDDIGAYAEYTLNSKVLEFRLEYFLDLLVETSEGEDERKKIKKELQKKLKELNGEEIDLEEKQIGKQILGLGIDILSLIVDLTNWEPSSAIPKSIILFFKHIIQKKKD